MQTPHSVPTLLKELASFALAVESLPSSQQIDWYWKPDHLSWSLTEVICHLRDVELEVHTVRYQAILNSDNPFLSGASTDEWAATRGYQEENGFVARDSFLATRQNNLALLSELDDLGWQKKGRHAFFGPTSLLELVNLAVQHDQIHLRQIEDLLANM